MTPRMLPSSLQVPTLAGVLVLLFGTIPVVSLGQFQEQEKDMRSAGEVYENLELYEKKTVYRVDRNMKVFNISLGVECAHCHVGDDWASEDAELKNVSRREIRMMAWLRREHFQGMVGPTCWTCHRGSTVPARFPPKELKPAATPEPSPFVMEDTPSSEAYKNIQIVKGLPARRLPQIMNMMSVALGVECSSCHVKGDWASDEKEMKQTARKMFSMRTAVLKDHYDEDFGKIFCWTCHRGSTEPEINPPM